MYPGIADALRVLSYLMINDSGREKIGHFPHTKEHVSACEREQRKSLTQSFNGGADKKTYFPGLLCLIRLCRRQRQGVVDEIKTFYSDRLALRNESSPYYVVSLQALIDVYDSLDEKDQDQQIRLMCGLCNTGLFKQFTNVRTISWLLDCVLPIPRSNP